MAVRHNARTREALARLREASCQQASPVATDSVDDEHTDVQVQVADASPMPESEEEQRMQSFQQQTQLLDEVVTHSYLNRLADCPIRPLDEGRKSADIRWYAISRVVLEKDTFFPDKLAMLYASLHEVAKQVVLVVNKDTKGCLSLYLGACDFEGCLNVSGEILQAGLHGFLPGIRADIYADGTPGNHYDETSGRLAVSSVSGLGSLHDDKKQRFVQSVERLINATSRMAHFTAFFLAESVTSEEAQQMIAAFSDIHDQLSPLAETHLSISESDTEGTSRTITENLSDTISHSLSHTVTNSEGFNKSRAKMHGTNSGESVNKSTNCFRMLWSQIVGGKTGTGISKGQSDSETKQEGTSKQKAEAVQKGETRQHMEGRATADAKNSSTTKGMTRQITFKNNRVKCQLEILDEEIKRLRTGLPFGLWSAAAYFVASDATTAEALANLYRGCIVGEKSSLEAFGINVWRDAAQTSLLTRYLRQGLLPRYDYKGINVSAGSVVTSKELAVHLSLPQSSVPGVLVREELPFGRSVVAPQADHQQDAVGIGAVLHLGELYPSERVGLSVNGLAKHTFVTGTTGSGKSNVLYLLLTELMKRGVGQSGNRIKVLVIEPAKGEYKEVFGSLPDVQVYGTNPRLTQLIRINPFEFPEGIDVYEHIDALVEIFNACWPMYAAMPQVLKHAIIEAYKACGWNLRCSCNPLGTFPTVQDVLTCLKDYINASDYSSDTKGDYKGALETRLQSLCEGIVGRMLNGRGMADERLFEENVIVDLSRIRSSETKSLLMGLLVMKLNEFRQSERKGMNLPLRHVTVLEEAHNLLKRTSTVQTAESSNVAGMAVEKMANSMAEMRTFGEGFIIADQSPSMLDQAAIRNTNTKIVMALPEKDDREVAGKALGLDDKHIEEISRLKTGEAVVYQSGWEEAVKVKIDRFEDEELMWGWHFAPPATDEDAEVDDAFRAVAELLADVYTRGGDFSRPRLFALLERANVSGICLSLMKQKANAISQPTADDLAFLFATFVGTDIYGRACDMGDVAQRDARILRELLSRLRWKEAHLKEVFLNMYVRGCSLMQQQVAPDDWQQLSNQ